MSLKMAILYEENGIYVEFPPEVFEELLTQYLAEEGSVKKALERLKFDLKRKTLYK